MNTRIVEDRLMDEYSDVYRTIWVQYTQISKGRSEYRVVVTLFPIEGPYTMLFSDTINSVDYDTVSKLFN